VSSYLQGEKQLEAFAQQFAEIFYDIHVTGDKEAIKTCNSIAVLMADVATQKMSPDNLKAALHELAQEKASATPAYYYVMTTFAAHFNTSVNQPAVVQKAYPAVASGTSPSVEFGLASRFRA